VGKLAVISFLLVVNNAAFLSDLTLSYIHSLMGRSSTKSVARVYADVNSRLGSSWYEYGTIGMI